MYLLFFQIRLCGSDLAKISLYVEPHLLPEEYIPLGYTGPNNGPKQALVGEYPRVQPQTIECNPRVELRTQLDFCERYAT